MSSGRWQMQIENYLNWPKKLNESRIWRKLAISIRFDALQFSLITHTGLRTGQIVCVVRCCDAIHLVIVKCDYKQSLNAVHILFGQEQNLCILKNRLLC